MIQLDQIKDIKPRQIKILMESGFNSAESLAMSNPGVISEIDGMSDKASKKLVWNARDQLGMGSFKPVSEMNENFEYITTGSERFNYILKPPEGPRGGISTGRITEVFGAFKSGKTNLSHTICVTVQLPKEQGGLGGSVLFIDTENTFSKDKIKRIAKRYGLDPDEVLANIYHARIYSSDHQVQMIRAAEVAIQEKGAKLIIVDSLMALLRSEYIGIGMLARRQALLNSIIHDLSRIAETHNVAVLVTNQVVTKILGSFSKNDAIGGNIVAHGCHFRIEFKAKGFSMNSALERTATIVDAPDLPPESANFFITEAGISDEEIIVYPNGNKKKKTARAETSKSDLDFELVSASEEEKPLPKKKTTKKKSSKKR